MDRNHPRLVLGALVLGMVVGMVTILPATAAEVPVTTSDYPPDAGEQLPGYGLLSRIVAATLQEMGMEPRFDFSPWARGQERLRAGRIWATYPYVKTPEREATYWFSRRPLAISRISFFYHADHLTEPPDWQRLEDLRPYVIGGVRGYWYEADFKRAGLTVEYTTTVEASMRKLALGRIDLFPVNERIAWPVIEATYPEQKPGFRVLPRPYQIVSSYLMVSRTYPGSRDLLERFDEAFESLQQRGIHTTIIGPSPAEP